MLYCVKKMFLSDQKKSSIVSGSRLVENLLITHHPHSRMCIRIYIFNFKNKQTSENKTKNTKKQKKLKKNRDYLRKIESKKIRGRPGEDFSHHPHFRKQKLFYFFFCLISITDMSGNISCFERAIFWLTQKARLWCLTPQELKWIIKVLNCSLISATSVAFVTWLSVKQRLSFSAVWLCWHL